LVGKIYGVDIRKTGSGNVGTTNALRTLGAKAGALTFLGDIIKVLIPILIVRFALFHGMQEEYLYALTIGLGSVLGHNFPFYLHFKGGKGIAVSAGVIIAVTNWWVILIGLTIFIIIVAITRYVSVGSLVVIWYIPLYSIYAYRDNRYFIPILSVSLLFVLMAYIKHLPNVKRIINGTENKLWGKKTDSNEND
jgi:glycerol-3-phosphate acyltransferase PlsY